MPSVASSPASEELSLRAFVPVALETLRPETALACDLFIRAGRELNCVLFRRSSLPLESQEFERLLKSGVQTLYVRFEDRDCYNQYLRQALIANEGLDPGKRYQLLRSATRAVLADAFNGGAIESAIYGAAGIAEQIVHSICDQQVLLRQLFSLMAHDYCTYTHANNVSTHCVLIARQLGIVSTTELAAIATGGLLHDIGKRHLPGEILNKYERLTPKEENQLRRHPQHGFEELCLRNELSWGQLMMVYQHHERQDGKGYPVQVGADEIHLWAKICAVADVFDAMTMERSYKKSMGDEQVLSHLAARAPSCFDPEIVRCLQTMLSAD